MELIISAIMSDLLNRALSKAIQRYRRSRAEETEHKLKLLQIDATVEEAQGRQISNQAMLRQLQMLRQGMYQGHHMLDTVKYRCSDDVSGDLDPLLGCWRDSPSSWRDTLAYPGSRTARTWLLAA